MQVMCPHIVDKIVQDSDLLIYSSLSYKCGKIKTKRRENVNHPAVYVFCIHLAFVHALTVLCTFLQA